MSPILLSPGDRLVTVFGGGKVALRKCRHFEGFRIRVVSPEVLPELEASRDPYLLQFLRREGGDEESLADAPADPRVSAALDRETERAHDQVSPRKTPMKRSIKSIVLFAAVLALMAGSVLAVNRSSGISTASGLLPVLTIR